MTPRGIRNRNPGNIRRGDDWRGLAPKQSDAQFCTFEHEVYGIRAMARVLLNYQRIHGLRTVRQMIDRWAPPEENNTASYVAHVSEALDIDPDAPLPLDHALDTFAALIEAIILHENGTQPYGRGVIDDGITLAMA